MNLTNKFGLPMPVFKAIEQQEKSHKSNADISCTSLIDSALRSWLGKKYYDQLEEDASDRLWSLYGSLAHSVIEKSGKDIGEHLERQIITTVLGWKVSAILDYLKEGDVLSDYKFVSTWATLGGVKPEWEAQLNVILQIMRNCDDANMKEVSKSIKKLEIVALFRDWVPSNADKFPNKVEVMPVRMWDPKKAQAYIESRVKLHQEARKSEGCPPICTDAERWMSDFAVCLNSKKTALKAKIKTREEAEKWKAELGADYIREAEPKRCTQYCTYSKCGVCCWYDLESKTTRTEPVIADVVKGVAADPDHARKDASNA